MKHTTFMQIALVFLLLAACKNPTGQTSGNESSGNSAGPDTIESKQAAMLAILQNVFNRDEKDSLVGDDDLGREVAMDSALSCIGLYEPEMYKHGIERTAGLQRPLGTVSTRMITKYEDFAGLGLLEWMVKTVNILDPEGQGKNVGFQLHMGIYTDDFLETYLSHRPELKAKKKSRVTIFIIPVGRGSFKLKQDEGVKAYELGGLQP